MACLMIAYLKETTTQWLIPLVLMLLFLSNVTTKPSAFVDTSINTFATERLCWSRESCKEEFQAAFTCRCPEWSYCRGPGRYYNAYCSIVKSGYIWVQSFNDSSQVATAAPTSSATGS